jgi:hypothetical protein
MEVPVVVQGWSTGGTLTLLSTVSIPEAEHTNFLHIHLAIPCFGYCGLLFSSVVPPAASEQSTIFTNCVDNKKTYFWGRFKTMSSLYATSSHC